MLSYVHAALLTNFLSVDGWWFYDLILFEILRVAQTIECSLPCSSFRLFCFFFFLIFAFCCFGWLRIFNAIACLKINVSNDATAITSLILSWCLLFSHLIGFTFKFGSAISVFFAAHLLNLIRPVRGVFTWNTAISSIHRSDLVAATASAATANRWCQLRSISHFLWILSSYFLM